ncbi:MAG: amylo-alpha-1,6-glucosidase [Candidatus Woesearchaeota archaeon]
MVGVEHRHGKHAISKEVGDARLLLSCQGSYFMLGSGNLSRYDGYFFFDKDEMEMYKVVEDLGLPVDKIVNTFDGAEIGNSRFVLSEKGLRIDTKMPVSVNLDCRKSYDLRQWGRDYEIIDDECIIVKFTKRTDYREDKTNGVVEYERYIAIKHNGKHEKIGAWIQKHYEYDRQRNSAPFERYVFQALKIDAERVAVCVAKDLQLAKQLVNEVFAQSSAKGALKKMAKEEEVNFAYLCAKQSLDNLVVDNRILAGLPWFFQFWARDEAIAVGALLKQKDKQAKGILFSELGNIQLNGRIPNRMPASGLDAADTNGWCVLRMQQLVDKKELDSTESKFLMAKLEYIFSRIDLNFVEQYLVFNSPQETWMDTVENGDNREGARIEIQALQLCFYKLLYSISKQDRFVELAKNLKARVKHEFFNGEMLADGLGDFTVRPNLFIAFYAYPDLLSKPEWIAVFDNALKRLWLEWGGLASIDKESNLFHPMHTGEDNHSYHRGDSWFWLNNLAAICMYRLDKYRYWDHIQKILRASTNEILWMGAVGHHAEISSAFAEQSRGCLCQAWSVGMYIELVHELR